MEIKNVLIGKDELFYNRCTCRDVRIFDKEFDIWTTKDVFGSQLSMNEISIMKQVNKAIRLSFDREEKTNKDLLIIETESHKIVVISKEVQ